MDVAGRVDQSWKSKQLFMFLLPLQMEEIKQLDNVKWGIILYAIY